jgi:dihydropteroate synthase
VELLQRGGDSQIISAKDWSPEQGIRERICSARSPIAKLDLSSPKIMGILNITPDSFSDGGELASLEEAVNRAGDMERLGAHLFDVGGESTRPGSDRVGSEEEMGRVLPVIELLSKNTSLPISIDSRKADVMEAALKVGASVINDVSALSFDEGAMAVAAASMCPVILMHAQGDPKTMQEKPKYENVLLDVYDYLYDRLAVCEAAGIDRARCVVDPGIGFGKTLEHNLALLRGLSLFHGLGVPILLGASRKSFIVMAGQGGAPNERIGGSLASIMIGAEQGVQLFRVHDVMETAQALNIWQNVA